MGSYFSTEEMLKSIKTELTFEKFLQMKSKWLNNFRTEWLVMGHLTEEEARLLVQESEKQLIYRHFDGKEEIPNTRLVQL
jgi:secreted Zn-dependent insulinase-like peptidase